MLSLSSKPALLFPLCSSARPFRVAAFAAAVALTAPASRAEEMFPFVIPGLGAAAKDSVVDMAWLNEMPAGKNGPVTVRGDHFVDGAGKRVKFLATNFTFGSCFPDHAAADALAARLASLGMNCVRFHHMDNQTAPRGIWKAGTPKKNEFDPQQLDRLDYFIAALKKRGIYANLNLHVSRNYWEGEDFADGLTAHERREQLSHYGKGIDKVNEQMIRMQRDYARALLTHVNPHTKTAYASEPCVAIVEINNENSLLLLKLDELPAYYRDDILKKWNAWLLKRHGSEEQLAAAWGGSTPLGENVLPAKITRQGGENIQITTDAATGETRVSIKQLPRVSWDAQLLWNSMTLEEGQLYTLEFTGRSDVPRELPLSTRIETGDYHNCGLRSSARLTPQWQTFTHTFRATRVVPGIVRFDMVLGFGPLGDFAIKDITLRPGGTLGLKRGESLAAGSIGSCEGGAGTARGQDWTRFLAQTERGYTDGMREFLKKDLGVRASIIDSQASFGGIAGCYRESFNDFVDMHIYWQHPRFPGHAWDGSNWNIANTPMVADRDTGNLWQLAIYRVAGRPFTVSEYDHAAPSHYAAEMFPMIASFAAAQDWDGLFQFDWGGTGWDEGKISSYFSLQQHPGKLAFLPAAALMLRRGDVAPARGTTRLDLTGDEAEKLTADGVTMSEAWQRTGVTQQDCLTHQLAVRFTENGTLKADKPATSGSQLAWDAAAALYTVNAPAAKAVVGRCTGKTTKLDGADFEVKSNPRDFAALTLNAADGKPLAQSRRLLLTAVGNVENTGMGWNEDHTSVGHQWGKAPTLCEGIAARITMKTAAKSARVHVLDGSGARTAEIPATVKDGQLSFEIGPQHKTLWFEIVAE